MDWTRSMRDGARARGRVGSGPEFLRELELEERKMVAITRFVTQNRTVGVSQLDMTPNMMRESGKVRVR